MAAPDTDATDTERDTALPGLATVLDPAAVRAVLAEQWSGHRVEDVQLDYLRYKPLTRCVAAYRAVVDDAPLRLHLTAYRTEDEARARRLGKDTEAAAYPPAVLPRQLVLRVFPLDRKLRALPLVADPAARRTLLTAATRSAGTPNCRSCATSPSGGSSRGCGGRGATGCSSSTTTRPSRGPGRSAAARSAPPRCWAPHPSTGCWSGAGWTGRRSTSGS